VNGGGVYNPEALNSLINTPIVCQQGALKSVEIGLAWYRLFLGNWVSGGPYRWALCWPGLPRSLNLHLALPITCLLSAFAIRRLIIYLKISRALLKSKAQGTSLFTSGSALRQINGVVQRVVRPW